MNRSAMQTELLEQSYGGRFEVAVRSILSPSETDRDENQDNYLIVDTQGVARYLSNQQDTSKKLQHWSPGHVRLAVLDGMGGHVNGRQAVERAIEGVLEIHATNDLAELSRALEDLHKRLHGEMQRPGQNPGCTLTLLEIPPVGPALLFHVGDSRLYAVDNDSAKCLTVDHVPSTKYAMFGQMDERSWRHQVYEQSGSVISQAFILGNSLAGESLFDDALREGLLELGDHNLPKFLHGLGDRRTIKLDTEPVYLLASDGLWNLSDPMQFIHRWPQTLAMPKDQPLQTLLDDLFVELACVAGEDDSSGGDNTTAIALRVFR